jgi:hypothetical protein
MAKNSELAALQRQLIALVSQLSQAQENSNDPATIVALSREIAEVTHRATLVGQLLFSVQTGALSAALSKIADGRKAVDAAVKEIDKLNNFLKAISKFLGLVDKVIDVAKLT